MRIETDPLEILINAARMGAGESFAEVTEIEDVITAVRAQLEPQPIADAPVGEWVLAWWPEISEWCVSIPKYDRAGRWRIRGHVDYRSDAPTHFRPLPPDVPAPPKARKLTLENCSWYCNDCRTIVDDGTVCACGVTWAT